MNLDVGELVFYKRGKGRVTRSLAVYKFKENYVLRFLTYHRPQITREQKNEGVKEKRIKTQDDNFLFQSIKEIEDNLSRLPQLHEELTKDFLNNHVNNHEDSI